MAARRRTARPPRRSARRKLRHAAAGLVGRGRRALEDWEPETWEPHTLRWAARHLRRMAHVTGILLYSLGWFFLGIGLLMASLYYPLVRLILLFATAAIAALLGLWFLTWGLRLRRRLGRKIRLLEEMAEMTNAERHAFISRRWRQRPRRPSTA